MKSITWKESEAHRKYRWKTKGVNDLVMRAIFYGVISIIGLIAVVFTGIGIFTIIIGLPLFIFFGLSEIGVWHGNNYSKRKITLNEKRIKTSSLFATWNCKIEHLESATEQEWIHEDDAGRELVILSYGNEKVIVDLPDEEMSEQIFDILRTATKAHTSRRIERLRLVS